MKQSVVKYRRLMDNEIKIVGFDHVATSNRIVKMFGETVGKAYGKAYPNYSKVDSNTIAITMKSDTEPLKELFQEVISKMKIAGRTLMDIKDQVDDTVREVRI